jgi:25S rRNA (uracil2634-N3)-methyltransferase
MRTLLVGEGNFSFARALVRLFDGNGFGLTATAYDSREVCLQKYHDAADILQEVRGAVSIPVVTRARL